MDPNANLEEALEIARALQEEDIDTHTASDTAGMAEQGRRLGELVLALDEWLANGNFKPRRWDHSGR
jgi:hypothetical protein